MTNDNVAEAQAAGYKIVNKNGETVYCRKELVTGTRLNSRTTCITESEWASIARETRDTLRVNKPR